MGLALTSPPAAEPLTLAEAKAHLRVTSSDEDSYITALITAARQRAEGFTRRALVTQAWGWTRDAFPPSARTPMLVPRPPLQSVDSIQYVDNDGLTQTWAAADYQVDAPGGDKPPPGRILPAWGETWPVTRAVMNAVTVGFTAGYGGASAVPQLIKQAMLLLVHEFYERRGEVVRGAAMHELPRGAAELMWDYRALE